MTVNTAGICSVCGMQMPSVGLVTHVCGGTPTYIATPAPDYLDTGDCPECGHEAHKPDGCMVPADFCDCPKRHAPPAPVCEKCGHMEHPDGECCWPLRRGPAGYVHKHCNCGGKRTPTPAPDLSPCTDCPPSDTTHAKAEHAPDDEMRPEYDFREGERGKYFERYNAPPAPDADSTLADQGVRAFAEATAPERMSEEEFERIASLFHIPDRWSSAHQHRRLPRGWAVARDLLAEARRARESEEILWGRLAAKDVLVRRKDAEIAALKACYSEHLNGVTVWDWKARAERAEAELAILQAEKIGSQHEGELLHAEVAGERGVAAMERRRAEEEKLRAEKAEAEANSYRLEAISCRKEIERLRAALEKIRDELGVPGPGYPSPVANAADIAREALEGKP